MRKLTITLTVVALLMAVGFAVLPIGFGSAPGVTPVYHIEIRSGHLVCVLRGPGGAYGFAEDSGTDNSLVPMLSTVAFAGHTADLPFRITPLLALGNIMLLSVAALYWYRRRNRKRPANIAS